MSDCLSISLCLLEACVTSSDSSGVIFMQMKLKWCLIFFSVNINLYYIFECFEFAVMQYYMTQFLCSNSIKCYLLHQNSFTHCTVFKHITRSNCTNPNRKPISLDNDHYVREINILAKYKTVFHKIRV